MGKVILVGIGPGGAEDMTPAAEAAIRQADALCGYTLYVKLLGERFPGKEIFTTPMTKELERCRWVLEQARRGKTVAVICSGDAGIYGMAGPVLQMAAGETPAGGEEAEIAVVPGITAAVSGAAVLGAPLMNDFCVISLSDLMTPWETIENRLRYAAEGDFAIVLYNPCSRKRPHHLRRACDILLRYKKPETVCGWVRNIGREGQEYRITTLGQLREAGLDMFCTVFIGSSFTENIGGRMVTPRGYEAKR